MGWFSKVLGIDSRKHKAADVRRQQALTDAAAAKAAEQAAAINKQQQEYQQSMQNMQQEALNLTANNKVDLRTDPLTNVVAGGTAEEAALTTKKKQKLGNVGMAAQLGINV